MKKLSTILILCIIVGCARDDRPKKPANLIAKDQMVNVLYDVYLLNAAKGTHKNILEEDGIYPQKYLFTKYNIDSLQFAKSNDYYSYDVTTYEEIINKVNARIVAEKKIYADKIERDTKQNLLEKDSIRKLSDSVNKRLIKSDVKLKIESVQ